MENNLEKIENENMYWSNSIYEGEKVTFVILYDLPYLMLTPVFTNSPCPFCKNKNRMVWLIGRENTPYRLHYCVDCKRGTLKKSQKDYEQIPVSILRLMNQNFRIKQKEDKNNEKK